MSYVKPDGLIDGHPASSKLDLFEGMVENIYDHLKANPDLMETTAFIIPSTKGVVTMTPATFSLSTS